MTAAEASAEDAVRQLVNRAINAGEEQLIDELFVHKGPHTVNGKSETALSGSIADKVKAAALAKVPGTVERLGTNVDGSAPYEAHIQKSNGTEVEVQVSKDFKVAAVNSMGDHGGPNDNDGPGQP